MEIKVAESENSSSREICEQHEPLLVNKGLPEVERNFIQQAISQTFKSTANLANLLPTGSVLAFQLLSPIFSNQGECDAASRYLTAGLVALCGLSCIVFSFTDSFKDQKGNIYYGFATFRGLWIIDGSVTLPPEDTARYKLRFIDFVHALMSIMVFAAIALFDQNVVNCFYPEPSTGTKEVLTALPVGIGVACSMLFVVFPTERHGIGFPVTEQKPVLSMFCNQSHELRNYPHCPFNKPSAFQILVYIKSDTNKLHDSQNCNNNMKKFSWLIFWEKNK